MLEELEGRLSWNQTPEGIVVHIPARRGSLFTLFGPLVGVWLMFSAGRYWFMLGSSPTPEDSKSALIWILVGGFGVSFCILLFWLAWALTSECMLTLDRTQMKIQHRILGIEMVTNNFATADAHNFRFIAPTGHLTSKGIIDPRTSKIQFKIGPKSHSFATGVTEREASALMDRMHDVYSFHDLQQPR
jgi:hypothetical protein